MQYFHSFVLNSILAFCLIFFFFFWTCILGRNVIRCHFFFLLLRNIFMAYTRIQCRYLVHCIETNRIWKKKNLKFCFFFMFKESLHFAVIFLAEHACLYAEEDSHSVYNEITKSKKYTWNDNMFFFVCRLKTKTNSLTAHKHPNDWNLKETRILIFALLHLLLKWKRKKRTA